MGVGRRAKAWAAIGAAALLLVGAARAAPRAGDALFLRLELFAKVLAHVGNSYVEPVDEAKLVYGAIKGMVRSLDPHSAFLDPAEYRAAREEATGTQAGVGLEPGLRGDDVTVRAVVDGGPAHRAGLRAGDRLVRVDGQPLRGLTLPLVGKLLAGAAGSSVTVSLWRPEFTKPRDVTLVREPPRQDTVDGALLDGRVAHVRVTSFQDGTDAQLARALSRLRQEAGGALSGVVLDLRDDPGGLLEEGVRVADRFLEAGTIVTMRGRGGRHAETELARGPGTEPRAPLVVLVDGGTASASEVVAGALQDNGRALVVGSRTYGKGSVQQLIEFEDGSALKLTTARYYTPRGSSIQGSGIEPDLLVPARGPAPTREGELDRHLANDAPPPARPGVEWTLVLDERPAPGDDLALDVARLAVARWDSVRARLDAARPSR